MYFSLDMWKKLFLYKLNKTPQQIKILKNENKYRKVIKCQSRNTNIPRFFAHYLFLIYNGRSFIKIKSKRIGINLKLGQFAYTRKAFYYPMRKKIKPRK